MKKYMFTLLLCLGLLSSIMAPINTMAANTINVTSIHGSANGWQSNTNWIGFVLDNELDLSHPNTDIVLQYEYVDEDGNIQQLLNESNGSVYTKNKYWSGYLNDTETATKYSSGVGANPDFSDIIPANTVISSNISNAPSNFPTITSKILAGEITYFRVRLLVVDETATIAYDGYTNWIAYDTDLSISEPYGINFIPEDYEDPHADNPILVEVEDVKPVIEATSITSEETDINLIVDEQKQLEATVTPNFTTDTISWVSSDPSIATVSETGLVTAISEGMVKITATISGHELEYTAEVSRDTSNPIITPETPDQEPAPGTPNPPAPVATEIEPINEVVAGTPDTGDNQNILLWSSLLCTSFVAITIAYKQYKKKLLRRY